MITDILSLYCRRMSRFVEIFRADTPTRESCSQRYFLAKRICGRSKEYPIHDHG